MTIYIGPDGRKRVDPGDLDRRQRAALARLARMPRPIERPAEPGPMDRERLAEELRQRQLARAAEYQQRRASNARTRAEFAAARTAGKRRHHAQREK